MRGIFAMTKGLCLMAAGIGLAALAVAPAQGQVLFTTQSDFSAWGNNSNSAEILAAQAAPDSDGSAINGLGNTAAPGATDIPGSLSVTQTSGTYNYFYGGGEQSNAAFLAALGSSGTLAIDYTTPTNNGGSYFEVGVVLNYAGNFGQFFGGTPVDDGNGFSTVDVPYTVSTAASYSYFQLGLIFNSNYDTTAPATFTVDNIRLVPEPASICCLGGLGVLMLRRRH